MTPRNGLSDADKTALRYGAVILGVLFILILFVGISVWMCGCDECPEPECPVVSGIPGFDVVPPEFVYDDMPGYVTEGHEHCHPCECDE